MDEVKRNGRGRPATGTATEWTHIKVKATTKAKAKEAADRFGMGLEEFIAFAVGHASKARRSDVDRA